MYVSLLNDSLTCLVGKDSGINHHITYLRTRFRLAQLGLCVLQSSHNIPPIVKNTLREKVYHTVLDYFRYTSSCFLFTYASFVVFWLNRLRCQARNDIFVGLIPTLSFRCVNRCFKKIQDHKIGVALITVFQILKWLSCINCNKYKYVDSGI